MEGWWSCIQQKKKQPPAINSNTLRNIKRGITGPVSSLLFTNIGGVFFMLRSVSNYHSSGVEWPFVIKLTEPESALTSLRCGHWA